MAAALLVAAFVCACGPKPPKGLQVGERGEIVRIAPDGDLTLADGLIVRLAGIDMPLREVTPPVAPAQDGAAAKPPRPKPPLQYFVLMDTAMGRQVRLFYDGRRRDTRGAATAQVFAKTEAGDWVWVQKDLLAAGAARVRTSANDMAAAPALLAAERQARAGGKGLWRDPRFAIRKADPAAALIPDIGSFVLIEGKVLVVAKGKDRVFLNFGADYKTDFTASIPREAWHAWPGGAPELLNLTNAHVRVRGVLEDQNGPSIELTHPAQLELLP